MFTHKKKRMHFSFGIVFASAFIKRLNSLKIRTQLEPYNDLWFIANSARPQCEWLKKNLTNSNHRTSIKTSPKPISPPYPLWWVSPCLRVFFLFLPSICSPISTAALLSFRCGAKVCLICFRLFSLLSFSPYFWRVAAMPFPIIIPQKIKWIKNPTRIIIKIIIDGKSLTIHD